MGKKIDKKPIDDGRSALRLVIFLLNCPCFRIKMLWKYCACLLARNALFEFVYSEKPLHDWVSDCGAMQHFSFLGGFLC